MVRPVAARRAWRGIAASVAGASRRNREDRGNQDAIGVLEDADGGAARIALADGHGDRRHSRSAVGADLAVRAALRELSCFAETAPPDAGSRRQLAARIVEGWRTLVAADLHENPLPGSRESGPLVPYGSTCLAVAATDRWGLLLQLGDGDVLTFGRGGVRRAFSVPEEPGEQTRSLCMADAAETMEVEIDFWNDPPELILAATDGLSKSYPGDNGFFQFGQDILERLRSAGGEAEVRSRLRGWLEHISQHGSGDDISAGLLFREFREEGK